MRVTLPSLHGLSVDVLSAQVTDMGIRIASYDGPRRDLRQLFELSEDSSAQLDTYVNFGRVIVAIDEDDIVGHLQLVHGPGIGRCEIKNMAVRESHQRRGIGRALVTAAIDLVTAESCSTLLVGTAAADIGNLGFYQRLGFRMASIDRDAYTEATGYAPGIQIDGIPLRDRVWLTMPLDGHDMSLTPASTASDGTVPVPTSPGSEGPPRHC